MVDREAASLPALYYEPAAGGHRAQFLSAILRYGGDDWVVAAPQTLLQRLSDDVRKRLAVEGGPVAFHSIEELPGLPGVEIWRRSLALARRIGCKRIFHPCLDPLILASPRFPETPDIELSGIFFRPMIHYCDHGGVRERFTASAKDFLFRRFLARRDVANVLTLDRYFARLATERYALQGGKVAYLPDLTPFSPSLPDAAAVAGSAGHPDGQKTRFLLFGALQRRKGVYQVLDAVERLAPEVASHIEVRFCGQVFADVADLPACIVSLSARSPAALYLKNRFLSQNELAAEVARCDVILATYQRHRGSSGVLYWAAAFGKPLIAQSYGLVGREVCEFALGGAIDTTKPDAIAAAMARPPSINLDRANAYLEGHSEAEFAKRVRAAC